MIQWQEQRFALQTGQMAVLRQPQAEDVRIQIYGEGAGLDEFNGAAIAVEGCDTDPGQPLPSAPAEQLFASEGALNQDTSTSVWEPMEDQEGEITMGDGRRTLQIDSVPQRLRLRETGSLGAGHTVYGRFLYGIRVA